MVFRKSRFMIGLFILAVAGYAILETKSIRISEHERSVIEAYLNEQVLKPRFGGTVFSEFEVLGTNAWKNEVYVWALIQEFSKHGDHVLGGTGLSAPLVLKIKERSRSFQVVRHLLPRDGSDYEGDIRKMFPKHIEHKIFAYPSQYVATLAQSLENKVKNARK